METILGRNKEKNIEQNVELKHRIDFRTGHGIEFRIKLRLQFTQNKYGIENNRTWDNI